MARDHDQIFTAQSVVAEIPSYGVTLREDDLGEVLGALFKEQARLPGVILTRQGRVCGAISRSQYLMAVGRYLGIELFHSRPISVMFSAMSLDHRLLVLPGHCPIQEALRQCLERSDSLVYEPFLVAHDEDGTDIRMVDFLDLLMADSRVSAMRNRQMEEILMTVSEGLLLIDERFDIQSEYSLSLERIFERTNLAGLPLTTLLGTCLDAAFQEKAQDYFRTLFNPKVIERLITRINPIAQVQARFGPGRATKHLRFSFMRSLREGEIHRVLVRVEDVTRQMALAEELEKQGRKAEKRLELGLQLVRADGQLLADFLASLDREIKYARAVFGPEAPANQDPARLKAARERLFRVVHGLKGEAGLLQLPGFEKALHKLEDEIDRLPSDPDLAALRKGVDRVQALLSASDEVIQQFRALARIGPGRPEAADALVDSPLPETTRLTGILPLIDNLVREQTARRGVKAQFHSHVAENALPARYRSLIKDCLVQFIRNSIAHGIEPEAERLAQGKPAAATLQFTVRPQETHNQWELIYQDDGRGLDLPRIQQRLDTLGWAWTNEEDLRQAIFQPGFTTADEETTLAGRGVGMDLVRTLVDAVGGFIQVHSAAGAYCAFQIVLPMEERASPPVTQSSSRVERHLEPAEALS